MYRHLKQGANSHVHILTPIRRTFTRIGSLMAYTTIMFKQNKTDIKNKLERNTKTGKCRRTKLGRYRYMIKTL